MPPKRAVAPPPSSGTEAITLGSAATASASCTVSVAMPPLPRAFGAPGRTSRRFVPMPLMRSSTCCFAPLPTASMAITEPTPITMPSSVRAVRNRLARNAAPAAFPASNNPASKELFSSPGDRPLLESLCCRGPGSLTMRPSVISMMRCACAATSRACVIRMIVWPSRESWCRSAITSLPLALSSAPVGSSARMMWPPFMSARAIETRCCWPPESWLGLWPSRCASPSLESSASARARRSAPGTPA